MVRLFKANFRYQPDEKEEVKVFGRTQNKKNLMKPMLKVKFWSVEIKAISQENK